jgi:cell division protein FtsB
MLKKLLIGFICFFLLVSLIKNVNEYQKNVQFYENYKKDYETEKKENNMLRMQAIKQSDPNEIEKTIRNKLNLIKPNEVAIIVPTPTVLPTTPTPTPEPVYRQWADVFFSR